MSLEPVVVDFTLTNHVHLSLTCGEAGWGRAYAYSYPPFTHSNMHAVSVPVLTVGTINDGF